MGDAKIGTSSRACMISVLAVMALAGAVRFWGIGGKSLWLDEAVTYDYASHPSVGAMVRRIIASDTHPPLHALLVYYWMKLGLGRGEGMLRVPSALAGLASVWLIYRLGRRLGDARSAIFAATLQALSCHALYFAQEARCYSLLTAISLGMNLLLIRMADESREHGLIRWGDCAGYALLAASALYTLQVSMLLIVAHWVLFLLLVRRTGENIFRGLVAQVGAGLAYLPWVPIVLTRQLLFEPRLRAKGEAPPIGLADVADVAREWILGPMHLPGARSAELGMMLIACAALVWGIVEWRRARRAVVFLVGSVFIPILLFIFWPGPRIHYFESKHLIFVQPICTLAVAGIVRQERKLISGVLLGAILAANLVQIAHYHTPAFQKERWREMVAELMQREEAGDAYFFNPPYARLPFNCYYHGRQPRFTAAVEHDVSWLDRAPVRRNIRRVWLVHCISNVAGPSAPPKAWLDAHWCVREEKQYPGFLGVLCWWLYERPSGREEQ